MKFKVGDKVRRTSGLNTFSWREVKDVGLGGKTYTIKEMRGEYSFILTFGGKELPGGYDAIYFEKAKGCFSL